MSYYHKLEKILGDLSRITQNPQVHILSSVEAVRIIQNCIINLESLHQHLIESDGVGGFCLAIIKSASDSLNAILEIKHIAATSNTEIHDCIRHIAENLTGCEEILANISAGQNQMKLKFDNPHIPDSEETLPTPVMRNLEIRKPIQNQIFISYSRKDRQWLDRLKTILKPLDLKYRLNIWDDQRLDPGDDWRDELDHALASAKLAILLVSANFLSSDFISKHELPYLLRASKERGVKLFWIPVSFCMYEETELEKFQAAGNPQRPLAIMPEPEADQSLVDIGKRIKKALGL